MSRKARNNLPGQFFHVMSQGINKEYIFNDDYLKQTYKNILYYKTQENNINIISYCIMDNHVHLLLNVEDNEQMSRFMKQVNTSYAMFYNNSNNRVGYVFRDRYLSKLILNEKQIKVCIAYIHKNPIAAKMVNCMEEYKFSSYNEYFMPTDKRNLICHNAAEIIFGTNKIDEFKKEYINIHTHNYESDDQFDDVEENDIVNLEEILEKYKNLSMNEKIIKLNMEEKISERKLVDIFKISRYKIRKILNK